MDYKTIATTSTPIRPPSVAADANLPLSSAAISGLLVGTSTAAGLTVVAILTGGNLPGLAPLIGGAWLLTALGVTTYDWFRQRAAAQEAIWATETRREEDLDGDHQIGRPHGAAINPVADADPGVVMQTKTDQLLDAIYANTNTTYDSVHRTCPAIDRADYAEIRNQLIRIGVAKWIGSGRSHGWQPVNLDLAAAKSVARKRIIWIAPSPTSGSGSQPA